MQIDSIDEPLRTAVYNHLHREIVETWYDQHSGPPILGAGYRAARELWAEHWRHAIDLFPNSGFDFGLSLKRYVMDAEWFEVYDLLEWCAANAYLDSDPDEINALLERDMSGFRLREGIVVPITDPVELATIDEAMSAGDEFQGARAHIADALTKLARRPEPDTRNAITEAVSAVESAARIVTGQHKATLADALKVLEANGHVHPALRDAWLKLYGYTSDEHGLRHAMTEDVEIDFPTAKYMVVSCSAFVNLLSAST